MRVGNENYRTLWAKKDDPAVLQVIDQRYLPHKFVVEDLETVDATANAIKEMHIRGAGLIGAVAAYGMYQASLEAKSVEVLFEHLKKRGDFLKATRPTAVNLEWAVHRMINLAEGASDLKQVRHDLHKEALLIADEDAEMCESIGRNGLELLHKIHAKKNDGSRLNVLTHCNAGWLAFVDWGSALAPVYAAHRAGLDVHVWVDETRPRNQGSRLTAWELSQEGIPHTIIADNTGGHLMQHGLVDLVIVGCDRMTSRGDTANKIGTYLKALAAKDNSIPFYVALPSSSIDWKIEDGIKEIPIEERGAEEVSFMRGLYEDKLINVQISPQESPCANYGFDVTPARLIEGYITEKGIFSDIKSSK